MRISFDGSATNVDENGFKVSPDSQRVVFNAEEIFGRKILYTVPLNGGTPIEIYPSSGAALGSEVALFTISPDSQRVVYRADQSTDDVLELYSAPITGASSADVHATKLNPRLPFSSKVYSFEISQDSKSVVYRADQDVFAEANIYHVPINSGSTTQLNSDLTLGGDIFYMAISADSNQVVYYGNQDSDDVYELYRVPLAGGTVTKLNASLPFGANTYTFSISPNNDVVVYTADQDVFQDIELFAVGITEEDEMRLPIKAHNGAVAVICL
ncbi:hypothetical protein [Arenicella xantha]|uniref:WD40 repeat protein n=1 Tax=Arenicella xantha TaxID=644221 RepID=A0A395JMJ0_9GAMM|nr:hypothetical protein [Arenicella xantha]RBP49124.1 hypothetical protein DFR28_10450 [Arenicella xantha]